MNQGTTLHHSGVAQLAEAGFSPAQIARLEQLRACYPLIEFVDSSQWKQLRFLKWLLERGQYPSAVEERSPARHKR